MAIISSYNWIVHLIFIFLFKLIKIGDSVYANGKNEWNIQGQCLHAKSMEFKHPITKKDLYVEADLPDYFRYLIIYILYFLLSLLFFHQI